MEAGKKQTGHFSISAYDGTLDVDSNHLTANANDVLLGASDLCEQLRHAKVEPCHVAYQLFAADAQGIGAQILQRADIDGAAVKGLLRELIDSLTAGNFAFDGRCVTFSQPFVNFLKLARTQQRAAKDKMIGVDHLALATCGALEKASSIGLTLCALQPAIAKMKVGLLQAKAEEEERKRCAATAQALVEGGNIGELDHELAETNLELERLQLAGSDLERTASHGTTASDLSKGYDDSELYDDY